MRYAAEAGLVYNNLHLTLVLTKALVPFLVVAILSPAPKPRKRFKKFGLLGMIVAYDGRETKLKHLLKERFGNARAAIDR